MLPPIAVGLINVAVTTTEVQDSITAIIGKNEEAIVLLKADRS